MSDVVINRKHYDDILRERDEYERERDALADALRELCADIAETEEIENTTFVSQWAWDKAQAALATLDDGFPP